MPHESQSSSTDGSSSKSGAAPRGNPTGRARVRGGRLPPIRQLHLPAAAGKKTFIPNIPQRRTKGKDGAEPESRVDTETRRGRGRRGGNRENRGRGRGRGRGNIIQLTGAVFEEGISLPNIKKEHRESYSKAEMEYFPIPKCTPVTAMTKEEKENEKEIIRQLLQEDRDCFDFMDDDDEKIFPVHLPLTDFKIKKEKEIKPDVKEEVKFGEVQVKTEPKDESEIPKLQAKIKVEKTVKVEKGEKDADIFTTLLEQGISEEGVLVFFQFPDDFPFKSADESKTEKPEKEKSRKKIEDTTPDTNKDCAEENSDESEDENSSCFSLRNLDEGFIGKLQVLESGKVRLKLGSITFKVESGTPVGFLQQLVSLAATEDSGDLISLGYVHHRAVCLPDFPGIVAEVKGIS